MSEQMEYRLNRTKSKRPGRQAALDQLHIANRALSQWLTARHLARKSGHDKFNTKEEGYGSR